LRRYGKVSTRKLESSSSSATARIRIASNGAEQSKRRSLYDMTLSAPKSISVMAIVGGDERLVAAHETAVRETWKKQRNPSLGPFYF
jgi:conjugative relaxase-like TrwC/TraI family protein